MKVFELKINNLEDLEKELLKIPNMIKEEIEKEKNLKLNDLENSEIALNDLNEIKYPLEKLNGLINDNNTLKLIVKGNKIEVVSLILTNKVLITLDYNIKEHIALLTHLNFEIANFDSLEDLIDNKTNKFIEKIKSIKNYEYTIIEFKEFKKDSHIKNIIRFYDEYGIEEVCRFTDVYPLIIKALKEFKKDNDLVYTIDFINYLEN